MGIKQKTGRAELSVEATCRSFAPLWLFYPAMFCFWMFKHNILELSKYLDYKLVSGFKFLSHCSLKLSFSATVEHNPKQRACAQHRNLVQLHRYSRKASPGFDIPLFLQAEIVFGYCRSIHLSLIFRISKCQ